MSKNLLERGSFAMFTFGRPCSRVKLKEPPCGSFGDIAISTDAGCKPLIQRGTII